MTVPKPHRRLITLLAAVCALAVALAAARLGLLHGYSYALEAHKRRDYALAFPIAYASATFWYEPSYSLLGTMYLFGQGVQSNSLKAEYWLMKAADSGEVGAQSLLGVMYATGIGVPRDLQKARQWLSKAAARGDAEALRMLKRISDSSRT